MNFSTKLYIDLTGTSYTGSSTFEISGSQNPGEEATGITGTQLSTGDGYTYTYTNEETLFTIRSTSGVCSGQVVGTYEVVAATATPTPTATPDPATATPTPTPTATPGSTETPTATLNVYARVQLVDTGMDIDYSLDGGSSWNNDALTAGLTPTCTNMGAITGLPDGATVTIRTVGSTTGIQYDFEANDTDTCPGDLTSPPASNTYSIVVSAGSTNNVAVNIDTSGTPSQLTLGGPQTSDQAACDDYDNNITSTVYVNQGATSANQITEIFADQYGYAYSTDTGWYSDGNTAIEWTGTEVDGTNVCSGGGGPV